MARKAFDDTTVPPLVGNLPPHCQRDVDTLRRFVHTVVSQQPPADPVPPPEFREVLLTGATGFIGRFFLCDLLQQSTNIVIHCVVRADNVEHGRKRIRDSLQQAEIWN